MFRIRREAQKDMFCANKDNKRRGVSYMRGSFQHIRNQTMFQFFNPKRARGCVFLRVYSRNYSSEVLGSGWKLVLVEPAWFLKLSTFWSINRTFPGMQGSSEDIQTRFVPARRAKRPLGWNQGKTTEAKEEITNPGFPCQTNAANNDEFQGTWWKP